MNILHIAPIVYTIPPQKYGGTERIVHLLARYQKEKGHDVTVIGVSNPMAPTPYKLKALFHKPPRLSVPRLAPTIHVLYASLVTLISKYDIVHNHLITPGLQMCAFLKRLGMPVLTTLHHDPPLSITRRGEIYRLFRHPCVAISKNQAQRLSNVLDITAVIHNGIDLSEYSCDEAKEDYLLYLGMIHPVKGVHIAIHVAKSAGEKLLIVGPIRDYDYFNKQIKPQLDERYIKYLGEVGENYKIHLLKKARALIFPVLRYEPFGLVVIEAMACGTPVITFNRPPMPEIVNDGVTGYCVNSTKEMISAVKAVNEINPKDCRLHVELNFSIKVMGERYLELYSKLS